MLRAIACSGLAALLLSSAGCSPLDTTNEMLRQTYKRLSRMNGGPTETADTADAEWDQFGVEARKGQPVVKENDPLSWMKSERHRAIERSLGVLE